MAGKAPKKSKHASAEREFTPEEIIEALRDARGIKRRAARILGCARQTIDNYFKYYPSLDIALAEIKEDVDDDLEDAFLEEALDNRNTGCLIRAVSTRLSHRGYGTQINANVNANLTIEVTMPQIMRQAPQPLAPLPLPPQALNALLAVPEAPANGTQVNGHSNGSAPSVTVNQPMRLGGNGHANGNGHQPTAGG